MIRVTIGNNLKRSSENYTPDTTLRAAMEQAGIDYTSGMTTLDGSTLGPGPEQDLCRLRLRRH